MRGRPVTAPAATTTPARGRKARAIGSGARAAEPPRRRHAGARRGRSRRARHWTARFWTARRPHHSTDRRRPGEPAGHSTAAGRHRPRRGGHPWIYSNEVLMDDAANALPPGRPRYLEPRRRRALGVAMFNPHPLWRHACSTATPRGRSAGAFCSPPRAGAEAARATLRRALLPARPCRGRRAAGSGRRPVRPGPGGAVQHRRHGPARAARRRRARRAARARRRSCCATTARRARRKGWSRRCGSRSVPRRAGAGRRKTARVFRSTCSAGRRPAGFSTSATTAALSPGWRGGARVLDLYCYSGGFAVRRPAAAPPRCSGSTAPSRRSRSPPKPRR